MRWLRPSSSQPLWVCSGALCCGPLAQFVPAQDSVCPPGQEPGAWGRGHKPAGSAYLGRRGTQLCPLRSLQQPPPLAGSPFPSATCRGEAPVPATCVLEQDKVPREPAAPGWGWGPCPQGVDVGSAGVGRPSLVASGHSLALSKASGWSARQAGPVSSVVCRWHPAQSPASSLGTLLPSRVRAPRL